MAEKIYIKNMVCDRCIMTVKSILKDLNIEFEKVDLGIVELPQILPNNIIKELDEKLKKVGFEIVHNENDKIVNQIKSAIIELIYKQPDKLGSINLSQYLQSKLSREYSFLSNIFSTNVGVTIEKYFILQRIERVKELLSYGEMTVSEIAYSLGYSSSQYLSAQFKKITGLTPSQYQKQLKTKRNPLDKI